MPKAIYSVDAKLFYGTAGATASTELKNVKDVKLALSRDEVDLTTREAEGWEVIGRGLKKGELTFNMLNKPADAGFKAISAAYFGDGGIAFWVTDGYGTGLDADFEILQFELDQSIAGAQEYSVTIKPTFIDRAPKWVDAEDEDE